VRSPRALRALFLILFLAIASSVAAQTPPAPCDTTKASGELTFQPFATRAWFQPLIAEPRGAQTQFYLWGQAKSFPYMSGGSHINLWEVNVGKELPVGAFEKGATDGSLLDCHGWGLGLWVPGSLHLIANTGEMSVPILNQDYRMAIAVKLAHAVTPRDLVSIKAQLGHESTHLGDEFVVQAIETYGDDFLRVNVSFEYLEIGVDWQRFLGASRQHSIAVRGSAVQSMGFGGAPGWYSPQASNGRFIYTSAVNFEPGVGAEYLPQGTHGWRPFVSYDGRLRTVYDYQKTSADQREDRQFSSSLVVGLRQLGWANRGMPDVIGKAYYGVNPHGQFRSQPGFWIVAVGLLLRL
jgi:hypothetical protein